MVKKKPNILDKMPAKKTASAEKDGSPSPPHSPLPPSGMTAAQLQKMEELVGEVNKLKAIILKHEVRIRDLEKANGTLVDGAGGDSAKNGGDH